MVLVGFRSMVTLQPKQCLVRGTPHRFGMCGSLRLAILRQQPVGALDENQLGAVEQPVFLWQEG